MNEHFFSLVPFSPGGRFPKIAIAGRALHSSRALFLEYRLSGSLMELSLPLRTGRPARTNGLWTETCFEFFLSEKGNEHYREFNLSPSGHWNVYRFTNYREGMTEDPAFTSLDCNIIFNQGLLTLSVELDLKRIIRPGADLQAAVCAVVKNRSGETSYWALVHPGPRPDFHRKDAFILAL